MNERIKELLVKAGVHSNWNDADWYNLSPEIIENFVMAIAKEIAEDLTDYTDAEIEGFVERFFSEEVEVFDD